ncbi:MAG: bifunctional phosphopantothenoylcysteine decarboxylase/phosphopantothenate--cysteine ligase CoaBC [Candidatus Marinimicrobia bacterium]|nr:bifunctional phosphopantothenoylcysteine decarboxylase/phosphopantothenate--cysteine ligase CoaBC [Candidatus Neomarinimicrobiota bacterium]|tara:strand:- start:1746 stop:2972 length:1227 start_codon:yes stop_codon:yes gene_type:complete
MSLQNKKVLLIVGGGISAYKSLDLIRLLLKRKSLVKVILTKSGKKFVTPLSISSLLKNKVFEEMFEDKNKGKIDHISLSRWADIVLVIPATANFISKLSRGSADDLASTVVLASNKEIFLTPAMNVRMWLHKATQKNLKSLIEYGYKFIGPEDGTMACGEYGKGKMSSPRQILSYLEKYFKNKDFLKRRKINAVVTSGPTKEYIDPVRYISNESSGKQGYEIALELSRLGIKTTLVSGPTNINYSKDIKIKKVVSGSQMLLAVKKSLPVDIAVCAAAVSDFKPSITKKNKIKKEKKFDEIKVEKNIDILNFLGSNNRYKPKLLVGFSAETDNLIKNSTQKMENKFCDIMVANDISKPDFGFNKDHNEVIIIDKNGKTEKVRKSSKKFIASVIAKKIVEIFLSNEKKFN